MSLTEGDGRLEFLDIGANGDGELSIVWLGHASFLIRWYGLTIVVDPVFRKWLGLTPRMLPIPRLERLGKVDAAFVTHGHMDHLDNFGLRSVDPRVVFLPKKTAGFLDVSLRGRSRGLEMGEVFEIGPLTVTVVTARHGGWRYPWQRGYFACGYVVSDGEETVYVSGDTAYGEHFLEIGARWKIDMALLPIGAYAPQWFLQKRHLNPEEACRAAEDLGAKVVIPFHFGTYRLSLEALDEPMRRFIAAAESSGIVWRMPLGFS